MKLVEVALHNFRGYGARTELRVDDLTVLVGKNDAGKSTVLEALNIALGDGKIDASDINVHSVADDDVYIELAFEDLPATLTLDSGSQTTLGAEYLVDANGYLIVRWTYPIAGSANAQKLGKEQVQIVADHPSTTGLSELHSKKNTELKKMVHDASLEDGCDLNSNASMRSALWEQSRLTNSLVLQLTPLDLSKEEGKSILAQVRAALPIYALFRADRPSTDQDAEVQDPMKVAIRTALEELSAEVDEMKARIKAKALEVATRTLDSLRSFDEALAGSLEPEFADPKLESAFKLALVGDDGIAVNKRGSGVRRLVLFSFFRAEAERNHEQTSNRGIIYAVEEPETAQHPSFQVLVVQALTELAAKDGHQVILSTHSPGLAGLLPTDSLRLVRKESGGSRVALPTEAALEVIAADLGVLSEYASRSDKPSVLVMLEGPNDVAVVMHLAAVWRDAGLRAPRNGIDCVMVPAGGQNLRNWVEQRYLASLGLREVHIYDRDPKSSTDLTPKYETQIEAVNRRGDGSTGYLTAKQAMENYLHWEAVEAAAQSELGISIVLAPWGDADDVLGLCKVALKDVKLPCNLKAWINRYAVRYQDIRQVRARGAENEITLWFDDILGHSKHGLGPSSS